jgi:uncharacterized membrane protein YhiD involved in acid resistance
MPIVEGLVVGMGFIARLWITGAIGVAAGMAANDVAAMAPS